MWPLMWRRTATRQGADTVKMSDLESREEMSALDEEIEEAEADCVEFQNGWGPKRILTEDGKVDRRGIYALCIRL